MPRLGIHGTDCSNCIPGLETSNSEKRGRDKSSVRSETINAMVRMARVPALRMKRSSAAPATGRNVISVSMEYGNRQAPKISLLKSARSVRQILRSKLCESHVGKHGHGSKQDPATIGACIA